LIKAGRLRGLAVIGPKRLAGVPDVPTSKESGFPDFEVDAWYAIAAPANTPKPIVARLNQEIRRVLETPAAKDALVKEGLEARTNSPDEMNAYAKSEYARWGKVVKAAGIKPE
jgi:tripartite-type tricarboxylate transporter receptor subunit TctC